MNLPQRKHKVTVQELGHSPRVEETLVEIRHPDCSEKELKLLFTVSQRNAPVTDLGGKVGLTGIPLSCHKKVLDQF